MAAVKVFLRVEEMHRATLAARATGDLAEKFGHAGIRIDAAHQSVGMVAIRRDDCVVIVEDGNRADGDRFLAVV